MQKRADNRAGEAQRRAVGALSSGSDRKFANTIADRLDASSAGMTDALEKIRRRRAGALLVQIPVIADRNRRAVVEPLHMADDLGKNAAEAVTDGDDTGGIKLRWLDVQQVIDASIGERALENVEGGQFAGFFDTQATLNEQFEQRPIPERIDLIGPRVTACSAELRRGYCRFPTLKSEGEDSTEGDRSFRRQADHGSGRKPIRRRSEATLALRCCQD